jgi:hypothetical protein
MFGNGSQTRGTTIFFTVLKHGLIFHGEERLNTICSNWNKPARFLGEIYCWLQDSTDLHQQSISQLNGTDLSKSCGPDLRLLKEVADLIEFISVL